MPEGSGKTHRSRKEPPKAPLSPAEIRGTGWPNLMLISEDDVEGGSFGGERVPTGPWERRWIFRIEFDVPMDYSAAAGVREGFLKGNVQDTKEKIAAALAAHLDKKKLSDDQEKFLSLALTLKYGGGDAQQSANRSGNRPFVQVIEDFGSARRWSTCARLQVDSVQAEADDSNAPKIAERLRDELCDACTRPVAKARMRQKVLKSKRARKVVKAVMKS